MTTLGKANLEYALKLIEEGEEDTLRNVCTQQQRELVQLRAVVQDQQIQISKLERIATVFHIYLQTKKLKAEIAKH